MAFSRRSLLETSTELNETTYCPEDYCISVANDIGYCPPLCNLTCPDICSFYPSYSPPLYTPPPPINHKNHSISPHIIILVSIFGGIFLLVCCFAIIVKFRAKLRRSSIQSNNTHEDFIDVNRGPVIDHPIWLITTVGLQDSIINAITVCKYKREGGLIEGTECSVCLNGFQDDETLRLLPKCSHAFHLLCIDTWLRSHTNCPLCRAPIVSNPSGSPLTSMVPSLNNLSSGNETLENHQSNGGFGSDQTVDSGLNDIILGIEDEGECRFEGGRSDVEIKKEGVPSFPVNYEFRVLSDLSENHRVMENEIQPVRRSVSMDSASASLIVLPMATVLSEDLLESSDSQVIEVKKSNSGSIQES